MVSISIVIVLSLGITYAWFKAEENENIEIVTTGTLQIKYNETSKINATNLKPATTAQVKEAYQNGTCIYKEDREANITNEHICTYNQFTITNIGSLKASVNIYLTNIQNEYDNYLKYMLFEETPIELIPNDVNNIDIIETNIELLAQNSKTYTLLIWLDENASKEYKNKTYSANIKADAIQSNMTKMYKDESGANAPVLASGMIPVMHDGSNWVVADYYDDTSEYAGYDYDNQKWANAVMVTSDTRSTYMNANVGTTVLESDILAYFVWIPRYKYKLFNATYASGTSPQVIEVAFESGTNSTGTVTCTTSEIGVETCINKENGNWYTHPAFTFGDEELEGIWIGKFETGYGTNTSGNPTANTVYDTPTIKPNVTALRKQNVSTQFITSQKFNTNYYLMQDGIDKSDSHMMKNIEWGAVAYLKQSIYGLGITDIANNNSTNFLTGRSAGDPTSTNTSEEGTYQYNEEGGVTASTTGNITGIYDMAGSALEYVMAPMQDNTTETRSPLSGYNTNTKENSGYIGKIYNDDYVDSGNTLEFPDNKYYDLYENNATGDPTKSHLGDALGETKNWYNDSYDVLLAYPWITRGGYYGGGTSSGIFNCTNSDGGYGGSRSFRVTLTVTN